MDLYEHQGKEYFKRFSIPVPAGQLISDTSQLPQIGETIGYPLVVKGQVLAGGRGKAGAIRVCENEAELAEQAEEIIGMEISGEVVEQLWVEPAVEIVQEFYASFSIDRSAKKYVLLFSKEGGIEIEQVAQETPEALIRLHICPADGFDHTSATSVISQADIECEALAARLSDVLVSLYNCFVEGDCDLCEINPLVLKSDGDLCAVDAKVAIDLNARFRHEEWAEFLAAEVLDERETLARSHGLEYIGLDGNVGIIANGAGLAMSTLDVISQVGGTAANFCDVGGGSGADTMAAALEVISLDENVASILVNIFGGITRCDNIANGILEALERVDVTVPIVVRLDGTNAQIGREVLEAAGLSPQRLRIEPTMIQAAQTAVNLATSPKQDAATSPNERAGF